MPAQAKTGDVRGGRDAEVGDGLPGDTVETSAPALQQRFAFLMIVPARLDACSQDAVPSGLVSSRRRPGRSLSLAAT